MHVCKMCHVQDLIRALAKVPAILFNSILQLSCAVDIVNKHFIVLDIIYGPHTTFVGRTWIIEV